MPSQDLGVYGADFSFPVYAQHSLDIFIQPTQLPLISVFDATVFDIDENNKCMNQLIYTDYELKMRLVHKMVLEAGWRRRLEAFHTMAQSIVWKIGDRFGEFNQISASFRW